MFSPIPSDPSLFDCCFLYFFLPSSFLPVLQALIKRHLMKTYSACRGRGRGSVSGIHLWQIQRRGRSRVCWLLALIGSWPLLSKTQMSPCTSERQNTVYILRREKEMLLRQLFKHVASLSFYSSHLRTVIHNRKLK